MPVGRMILFLAVVLGVTFGIHYYLWVRLVRDAALPASYARLATWAIVVLGVLMAVAMPVMRVVPRSVETPIAWVAFTWMGLMAILFFTLVPMELVRAAARLGGFDPERRLALARILAGGAGLVGVVLGGVGVANVLKRVGVARVRVPLRRFPKALDGYTIVQLTDVHVGPTIGKDFVEEIVQIANAQNADMICITGDLVDGSVEELGPLVEPLRDLRAKDGVYFVTGNHEYYSGVDAWIAHLRTLGIRVLRNERLPIGGDAGFDLAGVDDHSAKQFGHGHGEDVPRAMDGRDPARAVVLMAHQPKTIGEAIAHDVDLQLSGHTHGGQIWPWGYLVRLDQPHVAGLHQDHGTTIYVSKGTGYWGPPMRVGAPAEVTRIELRAAS